jgi:uncharacterized protein involved in exopolysaccharide biosynthesis
MGMFILRVIFNKIWLILGVPLAVGLVAFFFTWNIKKEYKSTAQLSTGFTFNKEGKAAKENDDYWESKVNFDNFIEIMKSEPVGSMVSYQLLLHDLSGGRPFRESSSPPLSRSEQDSAKVKLQASIASFKLMSSYDEFENRILGLLDKKDYNLSKWVNKGILKVERIEETDYINVEFVSEDPFFSAFVVNAVSQEAIRYNNSLSNEIPEDSVQFFATEAVRKKKDLEEKTERLRKNSTVNQNDGSDTQDDSKPAQLQLSGYQRQLREEEDRANGLFISLKSIKSKIAEYDKLPVKVRHAAPPKNDKLVELQNKINELNKIYVDNGSSDKALAGTISKLRNQLQMKKAKLEQESINVDKSIIEDKQKPPDELIAESRKIESDYKQAESRLFSLRAKVNQWRSNYVKPSKARPPDSTAYLEREHDAAFKRYARAVEKLKEAKSKALTAGARTKLVVPGKPSPEPESSKAFFITALAMIGCSIFCLVKVVLAEYRRATSFSPLVGQNKSSYRKIFSRKFTI